MTGGAVLLLAATLVAVLVLVGLRVSAILRRRRVDVRRREAILTLARDEMEANLFAIMSLSRNLEDLSDAEDGERIIQLQTEPDGTQYLYLEDDSGDYRSAYPIRAVETAAARTNLLTLAEIDAGLFRSFREYVGLMRDVERIRKDLVDHLKGQHGGPAKISEFFFEDMVIEGRKRLIRVEERLRLLHRSIYGGGQPQRTDLPPEVEERLKIRPSPPRTTPR